MNLCNFFKIQKFLLLASSVEIKCHRKSELTYELCSKIQPGRYPVFFSVSYYGYLDTPAKIICISRRNVDLSQWYFLKSLDRKKGSKRWPSSSLNLTSLDQFLWNYYKIRVPMLPKLDNVEDIRGRIWMQIAYCQAVNENLYSHTFNPVLYSEFQISSRYCFIICFQVFIIRFGERADKQINMR